MNCPHCNSEQFSQLKRTTNLGYEMFRCKNCRRTYNERSKTTFNFVEVPTDIIFQVLLSRSDTFVELAQDQTNPTPALERDRSGAGKSESRGNANPPLKENTLQKPTPEIAPQHLVTHPDPQLIYSQGAKTARQSLLHTWLATVIGTAIENLWRDATLVNL